MFSAVDYFWPHQRFPFCTPRHFPILPTGRRDPSTSQTSADAWWPLARLPLHFVWEVLRGKFSTKIIWTWRYSVLVVRCRGRQDEGSPPNSWWIRKPQTWLIQLPQQWIHPQQEQRWWEDCTLPHPSLNHKLLRGFTINPDVPETPSYTLLISNLWQRTHQHDYGLSMNILTRTISIQSMHNAPAIHSACNYTHRLLLLQSAHNQC